jgi:rhodanese-related sulfurtransferase
MTTQTYKTISIEDAKQKLDAGGVAFVDIRPPGDWAGGHVPGAQNLPLVSVKGRSREIPENTPVIFVDQNGANAPKAAEILLGLEGFTDVSILDGGLDAWRKAGHPMETIN